MTNPNWGTFYKIADHQKKNQGLKRQGKTETLSDQRRERDFITICNT